MKWNKLATIAVIAIVSISYIYSSIHRTQLSGEIKQKELENCAKRGEIDCMIIKSYHDECFDSSYRAEFKIRSFHTDEYQACLKDNMKNPL